MSGTSMHAADAALVLTDGEEVTGFGRAPGQGGPEDRPALRCGVAQAATGCCGTVAFIDGRDENSAYHAATAGQLRRQSRSATRKST